MILHPVPGHTTTSFWAKPVAICLPVFKYDSGCGQIYIWTKKKAVPIGRPFLITGLSALESELDCEELVIIKKFGLHPGIIQSD